MSDQSLELALIIKAINEATAPLLTVQRQVAELNAAGKKVTAFARIQNDIKGISKQMAIVRHEARRFALIGGLVAGLGGWFVKDQLVGTAAQFERFSAVLESVEGSAYGARHALNWVSKFAMDTPLEVSGVMSAFVRLRSFGLNPYDGTLQAIADANARLGGTQESLMGISLAMGQAWTRTKLQGQDILQMVERGVPVWDLLSKATGKSIPVLQKMSEQGLLGRDVMRLMITEMGKWAGGASARQMTTWNGMISNLGDNWTQFKMLVMDAGAFEFMKGKLSEILKNVNAMAESGKMKEYAEVISSHLVKALKTAWDVLQWIYKAGMAVYKVLGMIAWAVGGWGNLIKVVAALMMSRMVIALAKTSWGFVKLAFHILGATVETYRFIASGKLLALLQGKWAVFGKFMSWQLFRIQYYLVIAGGAMKSFALTAATRLVSALSVASKAVWGFTTALLANPVTWVVIGIAALAGAVYLIIKNWEKVKSFFASLGAWFAGHWQKLLKIFLHLNPFTAILVGMNAFLKEFPGMNLFQAGAKIISTLVNGIKSMAASPVETLKKIVQKMRNLLPFSPAKEGPFRDLHKIKLIETLTASITPAPMVKALAGVMQTARSTVVTGPGRRQGEADRHGIALTYAPVVNINGGGQGIQSSFEQMLNEHKRQIVQIIESASMRKARVAF